MKKQNRVLMFAKLDVENKLDRIPKDLESKSLNSDFCKIDVLKKEVWKTATPLKKQRTKEIIVVRVDVEHCKTKFCLMK